MTQRLTAAFLDFATLGPDIDTSRLDGLVDASYYDYTDEVDTAERLQGRQVALVNKAKLSRRSIEAAGALELIVVVATGTDNVDCAAAKERGVGVANIRDYCSDAVAQHVFALTLSLTQHVSSYDSLVRHGAWANSKSFALFEFPIRELSGCVLGLLGYGALGQAVGRIGEVLGMEVLVSERARHDGAVRPGRAAFDTVLERADVLSLHCPLTTDTRHLIGRAELERMKRDAVLINTARGALVDEAALADALRGGVIAGAGIDVLSVEPPPDDHPLLAGDIPNLILTPHVAWAARESRQRALDQVAENIDSYVGGEKLRRLI